MELKSLGHQSELIFTSFDGAFETRPDYAVLRTLSNPNYFWGNLLLMPKAPRLGECEKWIELFKMEFTDTRIYHMTFTWNEDQVGEVSEFLERGFELESTAVMQASSVNPPPKFNAEIIVRPITTEEWSEMIELQVRAADDHLPKEEWRKFYEAQSKRYIAMEKASMGHWFGAFLDNRLVAGLGIYHHHGLGRFQSVATDPAFQRRGICGTLVYQSARFALEKMPIKQLVMCADPDYFALQIYQTVGFKQIRVDHGLCWWDRKHKT
jgi:hypothetical protein